MIQDPINSSEMDDMRQQLDNVPGSQQNEQSQHSMGNVVAEGEEEQNPIKTVPTDETNNMATSKTIPKQVDQVVGEDHINSKIKLNSETQDGIS